MFPISRNEHYPKLGSIMLPGVHIDLINLPQACRNERPQGP